MTATKRLQSFLLFGGDSTERLVSVATAQNISAHSPQITPWFVTPDGRALEVTQAELAHHQNPFKSDFVPAQARDLGPWQEAVARIPSPALFVLGFHGGKGEDGTVQQVLESAGHYFTGSGAEASRKAFDKVLAKKIVKAAGLRVSNELVLDSDNLHIAETLLQNFLAEQKEIILKPVADGSSVGLFRLKSAEQIPPAVKSIRSGQRPAYLAETFLKGTEVTVGVFEAEQGTIALPPSEVEITSTNDFDYDAKYLGRGCREITPARLSPEHTVLCQKAAVAAHEALGCRGYTRTDLILTPHALYYLETNTLPGLTKASFIPQQLEAASIPFTQFLNRQLTIAQKETPFTASRKAK